MLSAITLVLLAAVLFGFYKINRLPVTTVIPLWLFIIFYTGLLFNAIITNMEWVAKPKTADPYAAYFMLQYGYLPIAVMCLIHMWNRSKALCKAGVAFLGTFILMAAEFFISLAGIFEYIHWNAGYSALLWLSVILISFAFYRFVESDFIKEEARRYA